MTQVLTSRVQFTITPDTRSRLVKEAARRHLDISKTARGLLISALNFYEEDDTTPPKREAWDIRLTETELRRLLKLGYLVTNLDISQCQTS